MSDQTRNQGQDNTGAGSRQQEQQTGGGSMDQKDKQQTSQEDQGSQQGGTYRAAGDRGVEFEADEGEDIDFQQEQQSGTREDEDGTEGRQGGTGMGADTRGGNETNR